MGAELEAQLTKAGAPDTEYFLVRQPIDEGGVTTPEVAKFDTSGKLKEPEK